MAAPLHSRHPRWVNPCHLRDEDIVNSSDLPSSVDLASGGSSDRDIFERIKTEAERVRIQMDSYKDNYVMDKFNMDMSTLLELFRDQQRYEWLPTKEEIPKSIGDPTPESALQALETSSFLPTLYEFFQKYSVGLEQVLLDEAIYEGEYLEDLKVTEDRVGALLCELQVSMMEKGITPNPDVSREIMSEEFRDIESDAMRNLRDWIILRDLMNALEFSLDALAYLEEHVPENEKNRTQNGI